MNIALGNVQETSQYNIKFQNIEINVFVYFKLF